MEVAARPAASALKATGMAMQAGLPTRLGAFGVWGSGTGVGKTLVSAGLLAAARRRGTPSLYLKPVQTGFPADSDGRLVAALSGGCAHALGAHAAAAADRALGHLDADALAPCRTLFAWRAPVSPHLAVEREGRAVDDAAVMAATRGALAAFAQGIAGDAFALVETAGGPASPGPSGALQADLLRPLRLPCVLVGDGGLGGISASLCAHDALLLRGLDTPLLALLDGGLANEAAIARHTARAGTRVFALPRLAKPAGGADASVEAVAAWLEACAPHFDEMHGVLLRWQAARLAALAAAPAEASRRFWWPFTQHSLAGPVTLIDSRYGDEFTVVAQQARAEAAVGRGAGLAGTGAGTGVETEAVLECAFDACASWWTQGVGAKGQPEITRAIAYAGARGGARRARRSRASRALRVAPHRAPKRRAEAASRSPGARPRCRLLVPSFSSPPLLRPPSLPPSFPPPFFLLASLLPSFLSFPPFPASVPPPPAARWGHVMFPEASHDAALSLARRLLEGSGAPGRGWASRVFFSDDGSTAMEIAFKMAFRKFYADKGLLAPPTAPALGLAAAAQPPLPRVLVVALHGSYHGDTLGAMDAQPPSVFAGPLQSPWYEPRGLFLETPSLALRDGVWSVQLPAELADALAAEQRRQHAQQRLPQEHGRASDGSAAGPRGGERGGACRAAAGAACACVDGGAAAASPGAAACGGCWAERADALAVDPRLATPLAAVYRRSIAAALDGAACGPALPAALVLEPVLQGAGGMVLVDPLFQRLLCEEARSRQLPLIFDEVRRQGGREGRLRGRAGWAGGWCHGWPALPVGPQPQGRAGQGRAGHAGRRHPRA